MNTMKLLLSQIIPSSITIIGQIHCIFQSYSANVCNPYKSLYKSLLVKYLLQDIPFLKSKLSICLMVLYLHELQLGLHILLLLIHHLEKCDNY